MNFELIKKNFDRGLWNEKQVEIAKEKGVITQEEYKKIIENKNKQEASLNILILAWLFSILAVIGSILNVQKIRSCFIIWTICNVFWVIYDLISKQYARLILDCVNLATSTWGIFAWFKKDVDK